MRTAISSQIIVWITNLEFVKRGRLSLFNLIKMVLYLCSISARSVSIIPCAI